MAESHWDDLRGRELRYNDHTWALTGDVEVRGDGEMLALAARATDDVGNERATLVFDLEGDGESINPGSLGTHFDRVERTDDGQYVVVKTDPETYRYRLQRLEQA